MTKRIVLPIMLLMLAGMFVVGCEKPLEEAGAATVKTLCGGCGQIKGSDVCCKADAEKCGKCDLAKGAPGCCKITKGTDAPLCAKCGQIKGSDVCCNADAEKCTKCKMAKGSPGCCK
jgi:hypothetical protein